MRLKLDQSGPWIGFGGIFTVLFVAFPAIFLYAPVWGIALIFGLTIAQGVVIVRLAKHHPAWCIYVPLAGLVAYFALLYAGLRWWGWNS